MITLNAHPRSSAVVRDRRSRHWSRGGVLLALLLMFSSTGCGPAPTNTAGPAEHPETAVAVPPSTVEPTSIVPSSPTVAETTATAVTTIGTSPPTAVLLTPPDATATWQTYQHAAYGVSLHYPPCFTALEPWDRYGQPSAAVVTLRASVHDQAACPLAHLVVHMTPLEQYRFAAIGLAYTYDATKDTWSKWEGQRSMPHAPAQVQGEGWTGYIFGDGDAGHTIYAVAIPRPEDHIMLEIGFIGDDPTVDRHAQRALEDAILATLRFSLVEGTTAPIP